MKTDEIVAQCLERELRYIELKTKLYGRIPASGISWGYDCMGPHAREAALILTQDYGYTYRHRGNYVVGIEKTLG